MSPTDHIAHFAREFSRGKRLLNYGNLRDPNAPHVRNIVKEFERTQVIMSHSGMSADIAMRWCARKGAHFVVAYEASLKVWVVRQVDAKTIADIATGVDAVEKA